MRLDIFLPRASMDFRRFHLNGPETLAEAMLVHTPGLGSDGVTVSPSSANRCNCLVGPHFSVTTITHLGAPTESLES